jgi:hypothetical protein
MPVVLPPGLTAADCGLPLARVLAVTVLAAPLVIVTVALTPALIICPFLTAAYRQEVAMLLASLQQWTASLAKMLIPVEWPSEVQVIPPRSPTPVVRPAEKG